MSEKLSPAGLIATKAKELIHKEIPKEVEKQIAEMPVASDGLGFNVKSWDEGIHREGSVVQHNFGQCFKALRDNNSEPGLSDDWERVGNVGLRWTGLKQADFDYKDGDLYIDGGSCFIVTDGKAKMFVQRGKNGTDGKNGADGADGKDAPSIIEFRLDTKGLMAVMDDGSIVHGEADIESYIEEVASQKALLWLEQQFAEEENIGIRFRLFRGQYKRGESYSKGDVVVFNKSTYIAREADSSSDFLDLDKWTKFAGAGGGGGGGGADAAIIMTNVANLYVPKTSFVNSSAGAPNAGQVPTLDPNGKLDGSFLAIPGGMTLKGSVDPTVAAVTTPKAGDYYIIGSDGTLDASYGLGALAAKKGDTILYSGTAWVHNESKIDLSTVYTKSQVDTKLAAFTGGLVFLKITAAAYNALPVKDPKTLYLVSG